MVTCSLLASVSAIGLNKFVIYVHKSKCAQYVLVFVGQNVFQFVLTGLNVHSMLKHETLVLTLAALEKLEERLLTAMHRFQHHEIKFDRRSMSQS